MSYVFDGSTSWASIADNAVLTLPDAAWLYSWWFKQPDNSGTDSPYVLIHGAAAAPRWYIMRYEHSQASYADRFRMVIETVVSGAYQRPAAWTETAWHNFLLERAGTTYTLYIDNAAVCSEVDANVGAVDPTTNLYLGNYSSPFAAGACACQIAELAKWNTTSAELRAALAAGQSPAFYPDGLQMYLKCLDNTDTTELINGLAVTLNAVASGDHPTIIYPSTGNPLGRLLAEALFLGA